MSKHPDCLRQYFSQLTDKLITFPRNGAINYFINLIGKNQLQDAVAKQDAAEMAGKLVTSECHCQGCDKARWSTLGACTRAGSACACAHACILDNTVSTLLQCVAANSSVNTGLIANKADRGILQDYLSAGLRRRANILCSKYLGFLTFIPRLMRALH
ncbi:hypothetical protein J6590_010850 [Homalodisca vitripennis]|nr:hypothetical protein J6590_010850 [Homalodisca vitripennis]